MQEKHALSSTSAAICCHAQKGTSAEFLVTHTTCKLRRHTTTPITSFLTADGSIGAESGMNAVVLEMCMDVYINGWCRQGAVDPMMK
jgi:hypothetical protein